MQLSEKIRILRKARGFSQEDLGMSLASKDNGVSRQSISDWENGKSVPKLENIKALAVLLNVSFDSLLDETLDLNNPDVLNDILTKGYVKKVDKKARYLIFWILFTAFIIAIALTLIITYQKEAAKYAQEAADIGENTLVGRTVMNKSLIMKIPVLIGDLILLIATPLLSLKIFIEVKNLIRRSKKQKE